MKATLVLFFLGIGIISNAQFFKNLGVKVGVSNSYYDWYYKPGSVYKPVDKKSDRHIGFVFQLTSDVVDKKYWGVNFSLGWLQRNAEVNNFSNSDIYKASYLSFNPSAKGKLPLGKLFNLYGQVGLNIDYMMSHSANIESYNYNYFYVLQKSDELKKINYGWTFGPGIEKSFNRITLRADYTVMMSFNNIIDAKGPRLDGLGDQGFFFKLKHFTDLYTVSLLCKLQGKDKAVLK